MVWLLTHMWFGLGLAALFGLLFGWAFRGISLKGKARDAMVQRDIALTELDQTRLELDHLYAAQSKGVDAAAQAGDDTLRLELEAREEKLQALSKELAASHDELEDLKSKAALGAVAAGAAAVTGAVIAGQGDQDKPAGAPPEERLDAELNLNDASLKWQNRYLASRVRALEAKSDEAQDNDTVAEDTRAADYEAAEQRASEAEAALEAFKASAKDNQKQAIEAALAASALTAAAGTAVAAVSSGGSDKSADEDLGAVKQAWQNNYLRQRLSFAQAAALAAPDTLAVPEQPDEAEQTDEAEALSVAPQNVAPQNEEGDGEAVEGADVQGEIEAWKTQHLAQRLAYLEEHPITERAPAVVDEGVNDIPQSETPEPALESVESVAEDTASPGELEQELARLRWRNRYLEGRLAYIDGDAPKSDAEIAAQSASALDDAEEAAPNAAEAVLAAMEGNISETDQDEAKPIALDKPGNGGDDLTLIEGIDADTAQSLNEAGIWHFYQIAGWSHDNIDWMNTLLDGDARIQKQDWVAQAGALSLGADLG